MTDEEIVRTWLDAFAREDDRRLEVLTAEGFEATGESETPALDRPTFVSVAQGLWAACPDWTVDVDAVHEKGDDVVAEVSIRGTQDEPLDLSSVGMGWMPPTGREVDVTRCPVRFALEDGRVVRERSGSDGMAGVLDQLGLPPGDG